MAVDLTKLTNLKSIGQGAFLNCSSIESVIGSDLKKLQYINGGTNNFGTNATFAGCSSLKNVDFHGCTALTRLGGSGTAGVFINCTALETADFSGCTSLTRIWYYAFAGCTSMITVNFADSPLDQIMEGTFKNCKATNWSLKLNNVTQIGSEAFNGSGNENTVAIDFVLPKFTGFNNWAAFANSYVPKSFDVHGSSITQFYSQDFTGCKNLESVDFSNCTKLTSVYANTNDWGAFQNCSKLRTADFSGCTSLNTIGRLAFGSCRALESVDFTDCPVTTVQNAAFSSCVALKAIELMDGDLTSIDTYAFEYCTGIDLMKLNLASEGCSFGHHSMAGLSNASSGGVVSNNHLHIYFYGGMANIPNTNTYNFINGINNLSGSSAERDGVTIHFPTALRTQMLEEARTREDSSHARTDTSGTNANFVQFYFICSNGEHETSTGGSTGDLTMSTQVYYAVPIGHFPNVVWDL